MDLKINDMVELLNVPEKTILKWIKDKNLPAYKIHHQYLFNRGEIHEWILKNNIAVSEKILELTLTAKPVSVLELVENGGVYRGIKGSSKKEVIENALKKMKIPRGLSRKVLEDVLMQREELMSTAVGHGIAFPHPRNPIISEIDDESISICFLEKPVDYGALDNEAVYILFIIISSNSKRHLEILSKLSFLCRNEDFISMLRFQPSMETVLEHVKRTEKEWKAR